MNINKLPRSSNINDIPWMIGRKTTKFVTRKVINTFGIPTNGDAVNFRITDKIWKIERPTCTLLRTSWKTCRGWCWRTWERLPENWEGHFRSGYSAYPSQSSIGILHGPFLIHLICTDIANPTSGPWMWDVDTLQPIKYKKKIYQTSIWSLRYDLGCVVRRKYTWIAWLSTFANTSGLS